MFLSMMLLAAATIPHEIVLREQVDCIERNNFFDDCGRKVFVQWIFLEEVPSGCLSVVAWRLDKGEFSFTEHPPTLIWADGSTVRIVRAEYWRETFSQTDPELEDRERRPKDMRRGLIGEKR